MTNNLKITISVREGKLFYGFCEVFMFLTQNPWHRVLIYRFPSIVREKNANFMSISNLK